MFWRTSLLIVLVGIGMSLTAALRSPQLLRSEATVLFRDGTYGVTQEVESPAQWSTRPGSRLREMVYARPLLEQVIREFELFPDARLSTSQRLEAMEAAVGFRERSRDTFLVSFTHPDPGVTQGVTQRLADLVIQHHARQNLDTTTLTRDYLRQKLADAEQDVRAADLALSTFVAAHRKFQGGNSPSPTPLARTGSPVSSLGRSLPRSTAVDEPAASGAPRLAPTAGATPVSETESEWHQLRSTLDRALDQLHTVQSNARAVDAAAETVGNERPEEMAILEPARIPVPASPHRLGGFLFGVSIAIVVAACHTVARVLLNDTLLDEGDIVALGGPEVLVSISHLANLPSPPPSRCIVPTVRPEDPPDEEYPSSEPPPPLPLAAASPDLQTAGPNEGNGSLATSEGAPGPLVSAEGAQSDQKASSPWRIEIPIHVRRNALAHAPEAERRIAIEAAFEDPEVEVIGADVDETDAGPRTWLESAPPEVVASLRVLRHRLDQRRGDGSFVVSVMSSTEGEGKTFLALYLALMLSEGERSRVILVDANVERPRLAAALGLRLPESSGFSAQLKCRMSGQGVAWGVVRLGPALALLGEPSAPAPHPEGLHSPHFEAAVCALRRSHDYVVIDGPGIAGSGDANVIDAVSDGVLLVAKAGVTRGAALSRAAQQLGDHRVLGVVLNDLASCSDAPPVDQKRSGGQPA